jgi:hypothetical protein
MSKRERRSVSGRDISLAEALLNAMGAKIASVDLQPGRLKIVTTEGREIDPDDDAGLNAELNEYRRKRGYGTS